MKRVAFVGLGIMGQPMAANLVRAGFDVVGFNRSPAALERLAAQGGQTATSLKAAVRDAEVIITMLPDSGDVLSVTGGDDGIFACARQNALYLDMSTILPVVAREIADLGAQRGLRVLDAPVSGGEKGAIEGSLSIMVGGRAEHFEAAQPILHALGTTVVHVGPSGAGQTVKAANQLIVAGVIQVVAEALVLLEACGVGTEAAVKVLAGGLAGNRILDRRADAMRARTFEPGFRVDLHHKDLGITLATAREAGVVLPVGGLTAQLMQALRSQGYGDLDHTALIKVVETLSGRTAPSTHPHRGIAPHGA